MVGAQVVARLVGEREIPPGAHGIDHGETEGRVGSRALREPGLATGGPTDGEAERRHQHDQVGTQRVSALVDPVENPITWVRDPGQFGTGCLARGVADAFDGGGLHHQIDTGTGVRRVDLVDRGGQFGNGVAVAAVVGARQVVEHGEHTDHGRAVAGGRRCRELADRTGRGRRVVRPRRLGRRDERLLGRRERAALLEQEVGGAVDGDDRVRRGAALDASPHTVGSERERSGGRGGGCRPRLVAVRTDGEFTEIAEHDRHVVEQLERHVVVREFGEQHLGVDVDEA